MGNYDKYKTTFPFRSFKVGEKKAPLLLSSVQAQPAPAHPPGKVSGDHHRDLILNTDTQKTYLTKLT